MVTLSEPIFQHGLFTFEKYLNKKIQH